MSDLNLTELLANLTSTITIPSTFHSQCSVVKKMLKDDSTGLINSLLSFQINSASVSFNIETDSPELSNILNKFLENINLVYEGKIPAGINTIAKEYFTERWSASSLPILKIAEWENIGALLLPSKMFIVDSSSVFARDKDTASEKSLLQYNYFLGKSMKHPLNSNVIFNRPFCRLWDKYTDLYLIRNGIYHNYKIIESLKDKQGKILGQIIPYLFLIRKGTEILNRDNIATKDEDYTKILNQYGEIMKKAKTEAGTPARATSFDEKVEHLFPDLSPIMKAELFTVAERAILAGLGYIDIAEGISSSRKESILSPKPFIEETKKGIEGFKEMLQGVINLIKLKNPKNIKYMNAKIRIVNSPITAFHTDKFKNDVRLLWERGQLSNQTYCQIVGEVEFSTEVSRRKKEKTDGIEKIMNPHQTQVFELRPENNNSIKKEIDKKGKPIPTDKTDDKSKFKNATKKDLVTAPYKTITELPSHIRKLSKKLQRTFMKSWNKSYYWALGKGKTNKQAEKLAFRIANSVINKMMKKTKGTK